MYKMRDQFHPLAGKKVKIREGAAELSGLIFEIEDYFDHPLVGGVSWKWATGNFVCLHYAVRKNRTSPLLPDDDEVLYGYVEGEGKRLVHVSEIDYVIE